MIIHNVFLNREHLFPQAEEAHEDETTDKDLDEEDEGQFNRK